MRREIWKPVKGYEGHYEVSNKGRLRSKTRYVVRGAWRMRMRGRPVCLSFDKDGYRVAMLYLAGERKNAKVHRLVAEQFVPNPRRLSEINHCDLDKANNWHKNLVWSTRKENQQHAGRMGLFSGASNPNCIRTLTPADVKAIRKRCALGAEFQRHIAADFGISQPTVSNIVRGKSWGSLA